jgi:hypothetical protein
MTALVTNIIVVTLLTQVTNVLTVTCDTMITSVYWLLWLSRHARSVLPHRCFLSCWFFVTLALASLAWGEEFHGCGLNVEGMRL